MTDATGPDEAAIRARVEAASEGPWRAIPRDTDSSSRDIFRPPWNLGDHLATVAPWGPTALADAEFIAYARTDLPAALDEITRLRAALDEARADAAAANGALEAAPEILRLAEMSDQVGAWKARAEAAESALAAVREWARQYVGQWHPASQTPLTFDGGVGAAAHDVLSALATPTTTDEGDDRG